MTTFLESNSTFANLIKQNKIEQLQLSKCNISWLDTVFKFLSVDSLTHLDLNNNPVSKTYALEKYQRCTVNYCLIYLNLSNCQMSVKNMEQVIILPITKTLGFEHKFIKI